MDDLTELGPAMRALNERQRKFVMAMAADPFGNAAKWARAAGYSDKSEAAKVTGHHLIHHPMIEAASFEVAAGLMGTVGPLLAARGMLRVAANPKHKKHLQAIEMLANRVGLHEVKEVRVKRTDETGEALLDRVKRLARELGVDPESLIGANAAPQKMIEQVVDAVPVEK
jgi:hypothetical protein